nr:hypothetical protein [Tanacetum cinerariifolium]
MTELTLEEFLCMFMAEIAKRHDEHSNLINEIQTFTDFALRNQKASIKALEIQVRQMSIILHEKLFKNLRSSTKIMSNDNDETISTSVEADMPSIRCIDASEYPVSNLQNKILFFESKKTTLPSSNHLTDDYWDELKETDGEKDLDAHYINAKPLGKYLPRKEKDPGSFTLSCFINNMCFNKALADLGASVSFMPYSTYTTLGLGDLIPTKLIIELADRTVKRPKEIAVNVLVSIDKFSFPVDFIILDILEDFKTSLILGRPFLSTAHAIINVFKENITLNVGNDKIFFKSNKPTSNIIKRVYPLSLIKSTELNLEARLMGNALRKNRSYDPKFEDFLKLKDLNEPLELRHDQVVDLGPTIEEGEVINAPMDDLVRSRDDELDTGIDDYPSCCDYDKKICIDCAYNLKQIRIKGNNVLGALMNVPIFVGTFSAITDFAVLEDIDAYRDEGMGDVIVGEPFLKEIGITARRLEGMITLTMVMKK